MGTHRTRDRNGLAGLAAVAPVAFGAAGVLLQVDALLGEALAVRPLFTHLAVDLQLNHALLLLLYGHRGGARGGKVD